MSTLGWLFPCDMNHMRRCFRCNVTATFRSACNLLNAQMKQESSFIECSFRGIDAPIFFLNKSSRIILQPQCRLTRCIVFYGHHVMVCNKNWTMLEANFRVLRRTWHGIYFHHFKSIDCNREDRSWSVIILQLCEYAVCSIEQVHTLLEERPVHHKNPRATTLVGTVNRSTKKLPKTISFEPISCFLIELVASRSINHWKPIMLKI